MQTTSYQSMSDIIDFGARQRYVIRRSDELDLCYAALERNEYDVLKNVAHKILGNCTTFGFGELNDMALALQIAARNKDSDSSKVVLDQFKAWVRFQRENYSI